MGFFKRKTKFERIFWKGEIFEKIAKMKMIFYEDFLKFEAIFWVFRVFGNLQVFQ